MKNKLMKNVYQIIALILFIIGVAFSYIIAEIEDAPGFVFIGTAITILACSVLHGIGQLIDLVKNNNKILSDICKNLKDKK